jgi:integral membrane sensor domain MASE1
MPLSHWVTVESPPLVPGWRGWFAFFLAFVAVSEAGRLSAFDGNIAAISLPSGVYAAGLLLLPRRAWPALLATTLAGNLASNCLLHGRPVTASVLYWMSNTAGLLAGATLLLREYPHGFRVCDRRTLMMFTACMAIVGTLISTVLRFAANLALHGVPALDAWAIHWQGRMLGIALIAPAIINAVRLRPWREPGFDRKALELGGLVAGTGLVAACVFGYQSRPLVFVAMPFLTCAAIRHRVCGAATTTFALGMIVTWNTAEGRGPFSVGQGVREQVLLAQGYLAVLGMVALTLAALKMEMEAWAMDAAETRQALEVANHTLQRRASTDSLTQLHNRGAFDNKLEEESLRADRHDLPLSLVLIDVDHFKSINDEFGHPVGDEVLRRVAATLLAESHTSDFVARFGGRNSRSC